MSERKQEIIDYAVNLYSCRGMMGLEREVEICIWSEKDKNLLTEICRVVYCINIHPEKRPLWSLDDPKLLETFNSLPY